MLKHFFIASCPVLILIILGCKDGDGAGLDCNVKEEGCACDADGRCEEGLVCDEGVCVSSAGTGGEALLDTGEDSDTGIEDETDTGIIYEVPLRQRIIDGMYSADPSAHVFEEKLYVYPSHDQDNATSDYNMVDYHVYSLAEGSRFIDHGEILHVNDVPWAVRYMWAPDAAFKNGTYFFYFPARDSDDIFRIGVATSSSPTGPFTPEPEPIAGSFSMDPAVFIDDDGQAYMYFGGLWEGQLECWRNGTFSASCMAPWGNEAALGPKVARLGSDMKSFDGQINEISIVDSGGNALTASDESRRFFEGAWMHKYEGTYYLSYSTGTTHLIVYATSDSPMGPFTYKGLVLPNHNSGWTTHHSIVEFQGAWYLFYHDALCSGSVTQKRCVKIADLYCNADGTIRTVLL